SPPRTARVAWLAAASEEGRTRQRCRSPYRRFRPSQLPPWLRFAPDQACSTARLLLVPPRAAASEEGRAKRRCRSRYRQRGDHARPVLLLGGRRCVRHGRSQMLPRSALRYSRCRANRGQEARPRPNRQERPFRTTPLIQQVAAASSLPVPLKFLREAMVSPRSNGGFQSWVDDATANPTGPRPVAQRG